MEIKSKIVGLGHDWNINCNTLTFSTELSGENLQNLYEEVKDKELDIKISVHRKNRSLNANAYYWTMLSKLASKMGESNNAMHNRLLAQYSEVETLDGQVITLEIIDTDEARREVREASAHHLRETSEYRFRDGQLYRVYQMMKGSSGMDTKQMSKLIEGLISECREAGISTITDEEAEKMIAAYGRRIG